MNRQEAAEARRNEAARLADVDPAMVRAHYDFGDGRVCVVVADPGDVISPGEKIWVDRSGNASRRTVESATAANPGQPTDGGDGSGIPHVPYSAAMVQELVAQEVERRMAAAKAEQDAAKTDPPALTGDDAPKHTTQIEDDGRLQDQGGAGVSAIPTGPSGPTGNAAAVTGTTGATGANGATGSRPRNRNA